MGRIAFLVDGLNLYHSLKEAQRARRSGLRREKAW